MSRVNGVAGGPVIGGRAQPVLRSAGFSVAAGSPNSEAVAQSAEAPAVALSGMLALQEAETQSVANSNAKRHGFALLDALQALQRGLLTDAGQAAQIRKLATLSERQDTVTDPKLAAALAAIRLRAKIELLRRGVPSG